MEVKVRHKQSFFDIAIQENGNLLDIINMAILNEVSITNQLEVNSEVQHTLATTASTEIVAYYKKNAIRPATVLTEQADAPGELFEGIGYMAIEDNFIIR